MLEEGNLDARSQLLTWACREATDIRAEHLEETLLLTAWLCLQWGLLGKLLGTTGSRILVQNEGQQYISPAENYVLLSTSEN